MSDGPATWKSGDNGDIPSSNAMDSGVESFVDHEGVDSHHESDSTIRSDTEDGAVGGAAGGTVGGTAIEPVRQAAERPRRPVGRRDNRDTSLNIDEDFARFDHSTLPTSSPDTPEPVQSTPIPAVRRRNYLRTNQETTSGIPAGTLGNETFDIRKATFTNSSADRVPSLCRAGFFSRGADIILCFRCSAQVDLTLQNPGHDDDSIWRFHASLMPVCPYVVDQQGAEFVVQNNESIDSLETLVAHMERSRIVASDSTESETITTMQRRIQSLEEHIRHLKNHDSATQEDLESLKDQSLETSQRLEDLSSTTTSLIEQNDQATHARFERTEQSIEENRDEMTRRTDELREENRCTDRKVENVEKRQKETQENMRGIKLQLTNEKKINEDRFTELESENNII